MRPSRTPVRFVVAFVGSLSATACGETPAEGYDAFLRAAQEGNTDAAFARFSRASREGMTELAARGETSGRSPSDFLFSRFEVRAVEHVVEISRAGDRAVLELVHFDQKTARVPMVREDGRWRIDATLDDEALVDP